ncbi:MAG: VWA domain-containing protein [Candidatus Aminicenantes bacterium]|nr:VWA domain-containing protein [Candidatus Aminicenantes bacterium]
MFRFAEQHFLYGLFLLPAVVLFFVWARRRKNKALERFGRLEALNKLMPALNKGRRNLKAFLICAALFFGIFALSRPQIGTKLEEVKRKGLDIFIAVDVSLSMQAQDIKPDRLTKAKHEVAVFFNRLQGDRIGLIAFAGEAFVQCPLTLDYGAAKMFLDILNPSLIPVQGTAIGRAIEKAVQSFVRSERKHKVLIIITDGEDTVEDPLKAAEAAAKEGIIIYTVGIGSPQGVPIPLFDESGRRTGFKKDDQDNVVLSRLNPLILEKIALATNGKYYQATPAEMELGKIYETLDKMEKKELSSRVFSQYEDRFQIFVALGIFLLILELLVPERKRVKMEWKGRFE